MELLFDFTSENILIFSNNSVLLFMENAGIYLD